MSWIAINGIALNINAISEIHKYKNGIMLETLDNQTIPFRMDPADRDEWFAHFCLEFVSPRFQNECEISEQTNKRIREKGSAKFRKAKYDLSS